MMAKSMKKLLSKKDFKDFDKLDKLQKTIYKLGFVNGREYQLNEDVKNG